MDWNLAIERNREALKRILAMLVAMAERGSRGQFTFFPQKGAESQDPALAEKSKLSPTPTLPRHLYRAVLALLRPAEAAARRLIIVAARGLVVTPAPQRPRNPKPAGPDLAALRRLGLAVVLSPAQIAAEVQAARAAAAKAAARAARPLKLSLPLFDPPRHILSPSPSRGRFAPAHAAPRILFLGVCEPYRLPPPPSPHDPIPAARLILRLSALGRALDDLPEQARRFARWRARRDRTGSSPVYGGSKGRARPVARPGKGPPKAVEGARSRFVRLSPLRLGRPPGWRRRPVHEVHELLTELNQLAFWALKAPDTS